MGFRVIPASVPASTEEWRRAMNAPLSELPQLTDEQMAEVRQFSLKEEEYKRLRVLLRKYVLERQHRQGTEFGSMIQKMIEPLGDRYSLATVSRRGTPLGWRVTIRDQQKGVVEFQCPLEVVEALAEGSASEEETEGLRHNILVELGQPESLGAAG
jgi:hypothetical protein